MYCILARWYKRRVRDEDYNAHRVVEEVYTVKNDVLYSTLILVGNYQWCANEHTSAH